MPVYRIRDFPVAGGALWRTLCLRSAGVPFELWEGLYDAPDVVRSADDVLDADDPSATEEIFAAAFADHWTTLAERVRTIDLSLVASAILWQNPHIYHHGLSPLIGGKYAPGSLKFRKKLKDVTLYVQRYVARNDSIGFFGPVGWGEARDAAGFLDISHDDEIVETGFAHLEMWPIEVLMAAHIDRTPLREHVAPMLSPHVRLAGRRLRLPMGATVALDDVQCAVLRRCDGRRTARTIASEVAAERPDVSVVAVLETLARLARANHVAWRLPVQPLLNPDADYRRFLESAPPSPSRRVALDALNELGAAAARVALDTRHPTRLAEQLGGVHEVFESHTGASAYRDVRRQGFGRTILCLEARRAVRFTAGEEFLSALRRPLAPLLRSAGWFLAQAADRFTRRLEASFRDLSPAGGPVDLVDLWYANLDLWFRPRSDLLDPIAEELRRRWTMLVPELSSGRVTRLALRAADLEESVATLFENDGRGWTLWPYCCPDVLPRVPTDGDDEAVLVLGELHIARNTLNAGVFQATHPEPDELRRSWDEDRAGRPSVRFVGNPLEYPPRGLPCLGAAEDLEVTTTPGVVGRNPASTWPLSAFVVERDGGAELVVRRRGESGRIWPLMHFLADPLSASVAEQFSPFDQAAHTPRFSIDQLVVARESYRVAREYVKPMTTGSPSSRYLAARRVRRDLDLPRYVFVRSVGEKPLMLDFDSPASVAAVARRLGRDEGADRSVVFTEMLPRRDELWLQDAAGRRYTSELRAVLHMAARAERLVARGLGPIDHDAPAVPATH